MSQEFYTVSELNHYVRDVLLSGFPRSVWVCGEIQGFNRNRTRQHVFFELIEKDGESEIKGRIGLVIFGAIRSKIESVLKQTENAFELKDDIEVKFLCKVDFYAPHGAIRLVVENIDPVYTLGKVAQDRQKLIAELTKSGTLKKNKELDLSPVPLTIGLITAHDSAAYNDFLDELSCSGIGFRVFFHKALMQGKGCAADVCKGLKVLNKMDGLDAIVITRGGGSIADLSCFDSKPIAEAIASSRYPVLTGIGHEINTSVTDLAAYGFEKTPTAIAHLLVERVGCFQQALIDIYDNMLGRVNTQIKDQANVVKQIAVTLQNGTRGLLQDKKETLVRMAEFLRQRPRQVLSRSTEGVSTKFDHLKKTIHLRFDKAQTKIKHSQRMLDLASPQKTLERGFSITRLTDGSLVRDIKTLKHKDTLLTEVSSGIIESIVNKI